MSATGQELCCQVRDHLLQRAWRMDELGATLGVEPGTIENIILELRATVPIESWGWGDRYHIIYPKGRVCTHEGCGTILSRRNPCDMCNLHGGGCYPEYEPSLQREPIICCHCHEKTWDYSPSLNYCRTCAAEYKRKYKHRKKESTATV